MEGISGCCALVVVGLVIAGLWFYMSGRKRSLSGGSDDDSGGRSSEFDLKGQEPSDDPGEEGLRPGGR